MKAIATTLTATALVLTACAGPTVTDGAWDSSIHADTLLLTTEDLPYGWTSAPEPPSRDGLGTDGVSPCSCREAAISLQAASGEWEQAGVRADATFTDGSAMLHEQLRHDTDLEPIEFLHEVDILVKGCRRFALTTAEGTYTGTIRLRATSHGVRSIEQTWSGDDVSMTARFGYADVDGVLIALTMTSPARGDDARTFDALFSRAQSVARERR